MDKRHQGVGPCNFHRLNTPIAALVICAFLIAMCSTTAITADLHGPRAPVLSAVQGGDLLAYSVGGTDPRNGNPYSTTIAFDNSQDTNRSLVYFSVNGAPIYTAESPSLCSNGSRVAFRARTPDNTGPFNAYTYDLQTKITHQITDLSGVNDVALSPDCSQVAVTTFTSNEFDVAILDASTPSPNVGLRTVVQHGIEPSFSPDGTSIVYIPYGDPTVNRGGVYEVNTDGTNKRAILPDVGKVCSCSQAWSNPILSHDGSLLGVAQAYGGGGSQSAIINLATQQAIFLSPGPYDSRPVFSPDDSEFTYTTQDPKYGTKLIIARTADHGVVQTIVDAAEASWSSASAPSGASSAAFVGMATSHTGNGYWEADRTGGVYTHGDAKFYGSTGNIHLNQPIVGMAATADGGGYWLVASDGGIFNFGDAKFYGSTGNIHLNQPIVGMASTPSGNGYWFVAADGGIFNFGDAKFYGSTGNIHLNQPIVGMAATADGGGYWLVASDGGIFNFGDAKFYGSTGNIHLNQPIVGMAPLPSGDGYRFVAADGGIFDFGSASFKGSTGNIHLNQPIVGMASTPSGNGYWLIALDGGIFNFGDAAFYGSSA